MTDPTDTDFELPSKSQLKREANELQALGQKLTSYSSDILSQLPISERLVAALEEYNRLPNSHGARRRQMQFIGKLMRDVDYEAVVKNIEDRENRHLRKQKKPSLAAQLCDRILDSGDVEINLVLLEHPNLERQKLRQLLREFNRAKSSDETASSKFRMKLQNYLQEHISS